MLELIYNPFYDQPVYAGKEKPENSFLRKKYVGKLGLLDELELRLGLSHPDFSPSQRLLGYYHAVNETDKRAVYFFHNSFVNDPLGVANVLLKWRDALVNAGWKQSSLYTTRPTGISTDAREKLEGLFAIEELFADQDDFYVCRGTADFWMEVLNAAEDIENDLSEISVHVSMTESLLKESDPMLHRILTLLSKNCKLSISYDDAELKNPNQKVNLYTIPDQVEAYQWLFTGVHDSSLAYLDKAVGENNILLVNEDNASLNGVLDCLGRPHVESQFDNVNSVIQQLFRNGLSQFRKPVDLVGLQNYLSSPYHPLVDFKKDVTTSSGDTYGISLKTNLLSYLKSQHGFGLSHFNETWDGILNDTAYINDNSTIAVRDVLGFWNTDVSRIDENSECLVKVDALHSYCNVMAEWCKKKKTPDAIVRMSLDQVRNSFSLLDSILEMSGRSEIPYKDLVKLIDTISTTISLPGSYEMLGSTRIVRQPSAIAGPVDCPVVWLDCYDKGTALYDYEFLVQHDSEIMNQQGMCVPLKDAVCEQEYQSIKRGLSFAENLYVIYPDHVSGQLCQSHPTFIEFEKLGSLKVCSCADWSIGQSFVMSRNQQEANTQLQEYHFQRNPITRDMLPKHESASSLDVLLNNPFDYVMSNIYKMNSDDETRLATLKGSVAHLFIHNAFEAANVKGELSSDALQAYIQSDYERKVEDAVLAEGAELLAPENSSDLERFKRVFRTRSLGNLIQIMKQYDLVMVASEYNIKNKANLMCTTMVCCPLSGSIDCILKDSQNNAIIFDFKWTESKSGFDTREEEVKENKALQLCVYRMAVEQVLKKENISILAQNSLVNGIGYYMLNQGKLITDCSLFQNSSLDTIIYYEQEASAFNILSTKICKLYDFRIQQILKGVIEEAEEIRNPQIEYFQKFQDNTSLLFPIKGLSRDGRSKKVEKWKLKKATTYGNHKVLKGNLK